MWNRSLRYYTVPSPEDLIRHLIKPYWPMFRGCNSVEECRLRRAKVEGSIPLSSTHCQANRVVYSVAGLRRLGGRDEKGTDYDC